MSLLLAVIGIAIGLIGVGLSVYLYYAVRRKPKLELREVSTTRLAPFSNSLDGKLTVNFDGVPAEDLWLTTLDFGNIGGSDIGANDFADSLEFGISGARIRDISASTNDQIPDVESTVTKTIDDQGFIIRPLLLKKAESITLTLLTDNRIERVIPPGRVPITNVEEIKFDATESGTSTRVIVWLVMALLSMIVTAVSAVSAAGILDLSSGS